MSMIQSDLLLGQEGGGGYTIPRSLRFNSSDSAYLSRTPSSAGNRKTWTWAGWVKRSALSGANQALFTAWTATNATGFLQFYFFDGANGAYPAKLALGTGAASLLFTQQTFRDVAGWYHIALAVDTTQATAANRIKIYVNGVQVTQFQLDNVSANVAQNSDLGVNAAGIHVIGGRTTDGSSFIWHQDGYLADIHFIDGQALTPSSFGEFDANGVWQPKAFSGGSYGTNGFHLDFADNSAATAAALGKDTSGNGNNWTPFNISVAAGAGNDSLVDSPSQISGQTDSGAGGTVVGNYCTWNPLVYSSGLSNGNLNVAASQARGTQNVFDYQCYWEITTTGGITDAGVQKADGTANVITVASGKTYGFRTGSRSVQYINITDSGSWTTWLTSAHIGSTEPYFPYVTGGAGATSILNAGQRAFAATAPSGYKALCTANLPTPTIANGATAMDVKLYTGNGSTQAISGLNFSPDLVWVKSRASTPTARNHALFDVIRGVGNILVSNQTNTERTGATNSLASFDSAGFSLGADTTYAYVNENTQSYAAWCWDAGSSTVTNTQGSITSQVRANASAGFSVVTYTGTGGTGTVGHGLGVTPSMIIVKNRSNAVNWAVAHAGIDSNRCLNLNTSVDASTAGFLGLNKSDFTSTTFTVNYGDTNTTVVNGSSNNYVAYCFSPVSGYSAFGSYTGNGSETDGPFVYTGFRPRWVLVKQTTAIGGNSDWAIFDAARSGYNANNNSLYPSKANPEDHYVLATEMDLLSNGFKPKASRYVINSPDATYVYAAFAEHPFAYARAR